MPMTAPLVIVGCGGHGRELISIVRAVNEAADGRPAWDLIGVVDDRPSAANLDRLERLDVPFLGSPNRLCERRPDTHYTIGIGDPRARAGVASRLDQYGFRAARLIHPAATVGGDCTIADGAVLFAGARVTTSVALGRHAHVNQNATVGHDSTLADYVSVNPLAAVSGACDVHAGALIGTNAAILQGLVVGHWSTVGAAACVVRDVAPFTVVKGVPAR